MNQITSNENNEKNQFINPDKQDLAQKNSHESDTNRTNNKLTIKKSNYHNKKNKTGFQKKSVSEFQKADEDGIIFDNIYPIESEKNNNIQYNNDEEPMSAESDNENPVKRKPENIYKAKAGNLTPKVSISIEGSDEKLVNVTGVRFKSNGKIYYFDRSDINIHDGDYVIVDTIRGSEFGEVVFAEKQISESSVVLPLRPVIRLANRDDKLHHEENKKKEEEATVICLEKIQKHGLEMKLVDAQYTFDNSKLIFYFTSSGRVDFRDLVKDLASVFKTRIELRQIGIRDEAKILGGLGACGRSLCCATFLSDFAQVSIKMAKEQNLSLNSGKISGCCGRLMCCLQYEYKTYAEETAKTPPVDAVVKTIDGIGVVTEINPLAGTIKVRLNDQPDVSPKSYNRQDVTIISRPAYTDYNDSDIK